MRKRNVFQSWKQQKRVNAKEHSEKTKWKNPSLFDSPIPAGFEKRREELSRLCREKLEVGETGQIAEGVFAYRGF